MRVYIDTCVLVDLIEGDESTRQHIADKILGTQSFDPCISGIVRLECLVAPLKLGQADLIARYQQYFAICTPLEITVDVCERGAEIRAKHGLSMPDALHLAIAEANQCDEFWTADKSFAAKPNERLRIVLTR